MTVPRFTIASTSLIVVVLALGLAALKVASPRMVFAFAMLTLALLLTAVLGVVLRRGPARAGWLGFAVFGWTFLVLTTTDWFESQTGGNPDLVLGSLVSAIHPQRPPQPGLNITLQLRRRRVLTWHSLQAGRLLTTLTFATLGAMIGRFLAGKSAAEGRRGRDVGDG